MGEIDLTGSMGRPAEGTSGGTATVRAELSVNLKARRAEIEEAALVRIQAISESEELADPEYAEGLRAAVSAALDYGFEAVELGEERAPAIPAVLLAQARLAARRRVSLDTVLRRYFAGYALLGDYLMEEAEKSITHGSVVKALLRTQSSLFDRFLAAISHEYTGEAQARLASAEQRRAERIERLLAGELVDISGIAYPFDGHHLGAIASGPEAAGALRVLAAALERRLLLVRRGEGVAWAWLGGRRPPGADEIECRVADLWPAQIPLALGEPGYGLAGWRLTHQQARAALPIAKRSASPMVRYTDVALLATMLQDDVLATSLRQRYLLPLTVERDGGATLRRTLRAYFAADRNVSSAAAALGVTRRTVTNRLRQVGEMVGSPLAGCAAELETTLRLDDLNRARVDVVGER